MRRYEFLRQLARQTDSKVVLLVLDGVGDIRSANQPQTPLEAATTPHLDRLAMDSALGRIIPASRGITPGSGPAHLSLFGYDPTIPEHDIGRGVLEALGLELDLDDSTVAARGNFATVDDQGRLTDRRAGRIPTEESERLCAKLNQSLEGDSAQSEEPVEISVHPGEGYRFVLLARGQGLSPELADTDPQRTGRAALDLRPRSGAARKERSAAQSTAERLEPALERMRKVLADEAQANSFLLRGFSRLPNLPSFSQLYQLRAGAFAGYPLYRGVASACGMDVVDCGKWIEDIVDRVAERWNDFDYFFLHVKQTDMAGEDGKFDDKVSVLERVDAALPRLLELGPDALAITGDHSTPVPMKAHSWHPVPLLVYGPNCFRDGCSRFTEPEAVRGTLGTFPAEELLGQLLAEAGKLAKYGA